MTLEGQVALITGSTSGIGLGIAREFARAGASIVLNGFGDPNVIESLRSGMARDFGGQVEYVSADVSTADSCRALAGDVLQRFGKLDILVNNAGIQHVARVEDFPIDRWDAILAVNLSSAFHLCAAALPSMRATGHGRIINIASVHGLVASKEKAAYVAAKHGLIGLTKVIALETAGTGITCNAICPGWVLTPLVEAQIQVRAERDGLPRREAEVAMLSEKQPSGNFSTPQQLGRLAVFLCSTSGDNMTGVSLPVDGGWTASVTRRFHRAWGRKHLVTT